MDSEDEDILAYEENVNKQRSGRSPFTSTLQYTSRVSDFPLIPFSIVERYKGAYPVRMYEEVEEDTIKAFRSQEYRAKRPLPSLCDEGSDTPLGISFRLFRFLTTSLKFYEVCRAG